MKLTNLSLFGAAVLVVVAAACTHKPESLVILHTNDTHSQLLPDAGDMGGIVRRMAVVDSIRHAEPNVLLVDAGDAVQGTLFFYLYGGNAEMEAFNAMDVDYRILGNHEFDNGIDSLAKIWSGSKATNISTNYDLSSTPLAGLFVPYSVRQYGKHRVGFIGLNLNPEGMIAAGNYDGLVFHDIVDSANKAAAMLRDKENADYVVALTHIGYNPAGLVGDSLLAVQSRGINLIIGGHSHDVIDTDSEQGRARSHMRNADGKPVMVVQGGKAGRKLGKIEIDLADSDKDDKYPAYSLIDIDSRYDGYANEELSGIIARYSHGVDSLMTLPVARTAHALSNKDTELLNYFSDYLLHRGGELAPGVDLAISNKGGLRTPLPEGMVSKGNIINMLPFRNYITVIDLPGSRLLEALRIMGMRGGDGVSDGVCITAAPGKDMSDISAVIINGAPLDTARTYRIATIDYLYHGGDYMSPLTAGTEVARSPKAVFDDMVDYLTVGAGAGKPIGASPVSRWKQE